MSIRAPVSIHHYELQLSLKLCIVRKVFLYLSLFSSNPSGFYLWIVWIFDLFFVEKKKLRFFNEFLQQNSCLMLSNIWVTNLAHIQIIHDGIRFSPSSQRPLRSSKRDVRMHTENLNFWRLKLNTIDTINRIFLKNQFCGNSKASNKRHYRCIETWNHCNTFASNTFASRERIENSFEWTSDSSVFFILIFLYLIRSFLWLCLRSCP